MVPLRKRPGDIALLAFFLVNFLFITYVVDIEQLIIPDPAHFTYPAWPPPPAVDLIHRYGNAFDPPLIARPAWWKATIWIDVLFFGPFYLAAIYAFIKGRAWIRIPSIIYGSMIITNVLIILSEERYGATPAPNFPLVLLLNAPWLLFPAYLIYRMARTPRPFQDMAQAEEGTALPVPRKKPPALPVAAWSEGQGDFISGDRADARNSPDARISPDERNSPDARNSTGAEQTQQDRPFDALPGIADRSSHA